MREWNRHPPQGSLPDEGEQLAAILNCVSSSPWSWGRTTLIHILHGDKTRRGGAPLHEKACAQAEFGALAFRSKGAIERLVDRLESNGLLKARKLANGGTVLDLTPQGRSALEEPGKLGALLAPPVQLPPVEAPLPEAPAPEVDESLYQKLRAWRLEQAQAQKVAPFCIFQNAHLRAIAARRPDTLEALSRLKGIGPKRHEKYGSDIVELVRKHLESGEHSD
jgi:superfamily II DNA helicase RecQ